MRRVIVFAACLILGGSGAALADSADSSVTTITSSSGRGRLGLVVIALTDELKQFYGSGKGGVLVGKVEPASPADKAGLKVGDVLASVDGKPVDDAGDVLALLAGKKKGDAVALTVMRSHLPMMLTARMNADAPATPRAMGMAPGMPPGMQFGFGLDDERLQQLEQRLQQLEQRLHKLDGT
jgi:membrane-associated protease RseP (regulator of RpoE activity)